jgi:hypothetical protein
MVLIVIGVHFPSYSLYLARMTPAAVTRAFPPVRCRLRQAPTAVASAVCFFLTIERSSYF